MYWYWVTLLNLNEGNKNAFWDPTLMLIDFLHIMSINLHTQISWKLQFWMRRYIFYLGYYSEIMFLKKHLLFCHLYQPFPYSWPLTNKWKSNKMRFSHGCVQNSKGSILPFPAQVDYFSTLPYFPFILSFSLLLSSSFSNFPMDLCTVAKR